MRGKVSGDLAMASASDMPSTTISRTSFHLAATVGEEASLQRITNARLSGTPAASRLDNKRVKFSSALGETFLDSNLKEKFPGKAAPFFEAAAAFSDRFTGRKPSVSICRRASGRPGASSTP